MPIHPTGRRTTIAENYGSAVNRAPTQRPASDDFNFFTSSISPALRREHSNPWDSPQTTFEFFFGIHNPFGEYSIERDGMNVWLEIFWIPLTIITAVVNVALLPIRIPVMIYAYIKRQLS